MEKQANKKVCILSIDGGGIRGILPGTILNYIEEELQRREGEHVRLADYFDMLAGTSTGGILTCAYLAPGTDGRPMMTASEAVDIYLKRGGRIFSIPFSHKLRTMHGMNDEKFPATNLESALADYFGELKLSQLLKPCLITSYDITSRKSKFFKQIRAKKNKVDDFLVKDVTRATSAAPSYFELASVKSGIGAEFPLVDGGLVANNPALCAYSEARTTAFSAVLADPSKPDYPTAKEMVLISVGTGEQMTPYKYDKAKDWGLLGWLRPLIDIMMSANSETVDYQLRQMFETTPEPANYVRLAPSLRNASPEMDDASEQNMGKLKEAALHFVTNQQAELNRVVDLLIANKSA